jgi:hypothetical protein
VDFVRSFDPAWGGELLAWLNADDALRSDRLGALVKARKKIAHGDGERVSTGTALQWAECAADVASWLIAKFDPT